MEPNNERDYLQDFEQNLVPVSKDVRFLNFLLDRVILFLIVKGVGYAMVYFNVWSDMEQPADLTLAWERIWQQLLVGMFVEFVYYAIFEVASVGRTMGKLTTKTVAVREDGSPITQKDAILRSLCRLIPFNAFAFLFNSRPWHDSLTKTMVVKMVS